MNTDSKDKNANMDFENEISIANENLLAENSVEEINSSEKCCSENSDNTNNDKGCCHKTRKEQLMNRKN